MLYLLAIASVVNVKLIFDPFFFLHFNLPGIYPRGEEEPSSLRQAFSRVREVEHIVSHTGNPQQCMSVQDNIVGDNNLIRPL
ncbi:hypothetical protein JOB18_028474 [Solea senegalensis]|uniref:Uncharacterized protein n=1 Tax=Solea senegalensis TaxID=28829 RepID=A0AAV6QGN8_SOLSE|nr:hypothetical protein JOB18_028474 [Solea senegalensis]